MHTPIGHHFPGFRGAFVLICAFAQVSCPSRIAPVVSSSFSARPHRLSIPENRAVTAKNSQLYFPPIAQLGVFARSGLRTAPVILWA